MPKCARHVIVRSVRFSYGSDFILRKLVLFGRPEKRADHYEKQG